MPVLEGGKYDQSGVGDRYNLFAEENSPLMWKFLPWQTVLKKKTFYIPQAGIAESLLLNSLHLMPIYRSSPNEYR